MADIIIIGAGTAGLTAAIYCRRAGMDTVIYEAEAYGGQIINTPEIENYPGFTNISGFEYATKLFEQATGLGTRIEFDKIISIEGDAESGFTVKGEYGAKDTAKAVIIAVGARNRHMGIDMEEQLTGKGVSYCATCDGSFYKDKPVAVFGGGNTAVEDAIYLSGICSKVYIVHRREQFRAESGLVGTLLSKPNVETVLPYVVKELLHDDRLTGIRVENTKDGSTRDIEVAGLFVAIGQIPSNEPFKDMIPLDPTGYAIADESCLTDVKGIFVAGDGRTKKVRQLTTAAADGAVAALAACDFISTAGL